MNTGPLTAGFWLLGVTGIVVGVLDRISPAGWTDGTGLVSAALALFFVKLAVKRS